MYDIIIIGCGPAGMTAAIYALRAGKKTLILEKETIGGQISSSPLVENYPGFKAISGSDLSNELYDQVLNLGGEIELEEVLKIEEGKIKKVTTDYNTYEAKSIIIATGSRFRRLGLDNEEELVGNGVHFCVACDGAFYKNRVVGVIGGGNSAVINAITLSDIAKKVYIIQNLPELTSENTLTNRLMNKKNIDIYYNSTVSKLNADKDFKSITINNNGKEETIEMDGIFISIGQIPQNEIFKDLITLNDCRYIDANEECKTNVEGIFVAGDCRDKKVRQVTTATSDGTTAALQAIRYIEKNTQ